MAVSPFDSALHGRLYGDAEIGPLFSEEAEVAALIRFERALARAQAACGVIPAEAAAAINRELSGITVAPGDLARGAAAAGAVTPALLDALRPRLSAPAAHWLHWGATSQDAEDTGLVLRLGMALGIFDDRLGRLAARLAEHARRWRDTPMAGRTRSQLATPISFGLRVARWRAPLVALAEELPALRGRVLRVQLGGAAGANDVLGERAGAVATALATELGLAAAPCWHTDRSGLAGLASWCARLSAALGKIAGDLILMGRSEIGEARAGAGGGSSTMPQKANPVAAETVVALARHAAALTAPMHAAAIWAEERDGASWAQERLALPQVVVATGAALGHALALAETLAPDPERMRRTLGLDGGAALAERASYLLARTMSRTEARELVSQALADRPADATLADALGRLAPRIDWAAELDPECVDAAAAATDAALAPRDGA